MYDKVCTNTVLYTVRTCMLSLRIYVLYEYCVHTSMLAWYCVIKVTVQGTRIQRYRKNRRTRADQSFF